MSITESILAFWSSGRPTSAPPALAYFSRRHTEGGLVDLASILGLSRPESVPNLTRRFTASIQKHSTARRDLNLLEKTLAEARDEEKN